MLALKLFSQNHAGTERVQGGGVYRLKHSSTSKANCVSFTSLDPPLFPSNPPVPVSITTAKFRVFGFLSENFLAISCLKKKGGKKERKKGEIRPSRILLIAYSVSRSCGVGFFFCIVQVLNTLELGRRSLL